MYKVDFTIDYKGTPIQRVYTDYGISYVVYGVMCHNLESAKRCVNDKLAGNIAAPCEPVESS